MMADSVEDMSENDTAQIETISKSVQENGNIEVHSHDSHSIADDNSEVDTRCGYGHASLTGCKNIILHFGC